MRKADLPQEITTIFKDKRICVIGSVPPNDFDASAFDIIVRCNDHYAVDEGPCDVLVHVGSSEKIKPEWLIQTLSGKLKALFIYSRGASAAKMKMIAENHGIPVILYGEESFYLEPLYTYFQAHGGRPSTGMAAAYIMACLEPKELLITGANLYAHEPDHIGWYKHLPVVHADCYEHLENRYPFIFLGDDLRDGMRYWWDRGDELNL